ncbi:MAG: DUF4860 domain-containing protein [Blautia sp.]|nr:DUF4860 domain-containing protein [Blautia sp.]
MNSPSNPSNNKGSIAAFGTFILFSVFILILLVLILFSAGAYRSAVRGEQENFNLRTAGAYLTTKFHQYDTKNDITLETFHGLDALCFHETIDGQSFRTYIYHHDHSLKELFTTENSNIMPEAGTSIADLEAFQIEGSGSGFFRITMRDENGVCSRLVLHNGISE